jgi:hypothetical protein
MIPADILPIINSKLKNDAVSEDDRLLAIEEVGQVILDYCHIGEIPAALKFTWANMSVDLLVYQQAASTPSDASSESTQTAGAVSSVKEGDTTVSFGGQSPDAADRDRALDTHKAKLDALVMDYKAQLRRYRKVVW